MVHPILFCSIPSVQSVNAGGGMWALRKMFLYTKKRKSSVGKMVGFIKKRITLQN